MNKRFRFIVWGTVLLVLSGCGGIRNEYRERVRYRLTAAPETAAVQDTDTGEPLVVKRFDISPEFEGDALVSRLAQNRFSPANYHQYMVPPARMITDAIRERLFASPLFSQISPDTAEEIHYRVFGKVIQLYRDLRQGNRPQAVITLRMALEKNTGKSFERVFQNTYSQSILLDGPSPDLYIRGLNTGLARILDAFLADAKAAGID